MRIVDLHIPLKKTTIDHESVKRLRTLAMSSLPTMHPGHYVKICHRVVCVALSSTTADQSAKISKGIVYPMFRPSPPLMPNFGAPLHPVRVRRNHLRQNQNSYIPITIVPDHSQSAAASHPAARCLGHRIDSSETIRNATTLRGQLDDVDPREIFIIKQRRLIGEENMCISFMGTMQRANKSQRTVQEQATNL